MIFRFLTLALCGTCVVLLATLPPLRIAMIPPGYAPPPALAPCRFDPGPPRLSVIDVAPGVAPSRLVDLLHLRSYEHIAAVDDRALEEDLPAGPQIAELAPLPGGFLDLTVSSPWAERRVLVLLHGTGTPRMR
jgi:hypothetical protein